MADLVQTAANVRLRSATTPRLDTAGETITAGQPIRRVNNVMMRSGAGSTAAVAEADGIALIGASEGDPVIWAPPGSSVDLGATLAIGETYVVSATLGAIAPIGDLTTGDHVTILGVGAAANSLLLRPHASGVEKA